jgi:L-glyceraldehyde 3-phosphate reductase
MTYLASEHRYEHLPFRRAGSSGLDLPSFSLGLWQKFGTDYDYDTQREIILHAFDLGITHFDIANRYGPPFRAAEKLFGRLLKSDLGRYREELVISSKAGGFLGDSPYLQGGSRKSLLTSLDHSLRDLGVDYVDIFYHHRPDPTVPLEETTSALADAVRQGKALYIGISNYYDTAAAHQAVQLLRALGVPLLVHQPRYSIFDRRIETEGLLSFAQDEGVGLVVFSPLAQGLLTDKYLDGEIPQDARASRSAFLSPDAITEEYIARARALNEIAAERGQSLAQLALQWVLRQPQVSTALIGASSAWQLDHNLKALEFPPLTDEELGQIDEYGVHGTGVRV